MPLRLNLNHEQEKLRAERARDPLKLSMMGLGVVIAGFVAQYFWVVAQGSSVNKQLAQRRNEFAEITPKSEAAALEEVELRKLLDNSAKLVGRIENRYHWAPLLQQLVQIVPKDVQITRFTGDAQGDIAKKVQFNIDGISAGPDPRKVAEDMRQNLIDKLSKIYKNVSASFRHLEDGTDQVKLDGKMLQTANFSINVQFQSGEEPETPVPRRAK